MLKPNISLWGMYIETVAKMCFYSGTPQFNQYERLQIEETIT